MTVSPTEEKATKTPRFRSAPYPAITLPKALERSGQMYEKALHHSVPVTVPAEAWGYAVKSSGLFATIAALKQYGLLLDEGSGDKRRFRLSDDALRIAKDPDPNSEKRKAAIHRAALAPPIYKELWEKYGSAAATGTMDMVLKTHLTLDRGDMGLATYADKAADDIIAGFQKAVSSSGLLASGSSLNESDGDDHEGNGSDGPGDEVSEKHADEQPNPTSGHGSPNKPNLSDAPPPRKDGVPTISMSDDGLVISAGVITTMRQFDRLLMRLQAGKVLLEEETDDWD